MKLAYVWLAATATLVSLGCGARASAQPDAIPDSIAVEPKKSKKGGGQAVFVEGPGLDKLSETDSEASVDWSLSAGGAINTGNTQSWNLNAGTDLLLKKNEHRLTIDSLFTFGRANTDVLDSSSGYATIAKRWLWSSRYGFYFTRMDAIWTTLVLRWDPLAGFNLQLLANAGYLRAFVNEDDHILAGRVGYSYTYENYVEETQIIGTTFAKTSNIHGLLIGLEYDNRLNEHVTFSTGISYIGNLNRIEAQNARPFQDNRIYFNVSLLSEVADRLAVEARFLLLYDSLPAGRFTTDTATIFSLVYTPFQASDR